MGKRTTTTTSTAATTATTVKACDTCAVSRGAEATVLHKTENTHMLGHMRLHTHTHTYTRTHTHIYNTQAYTHIV